jgi:hypothetical protein
MGATEVADFAIVHDVTDHGVLTDVRCMLCDRFVRGYFAEDLRDAWMIEHAGRCPDPAQLWLDVEPEA